ncbi:MAG: sugar ABC transporter permease [Chloroflexota bacterium]|nr:sugar ABC transporter permease [Chloroflexota bacterium]
MTAHGRPTNPLLRSERRWAVFFLTPSIIGFLAFTALPVVASLGLSFVKWNLIHPPEFVGLGNYARALHDPMFWRVLKNTAVYTVGTVPTSMALSLALALALNQKIRGVTLFRGLYYLPVVAPMVAITMVWRWLYNSNFGMINYLLSLVNVPAVPWLTSTRWAMPSVIIMSVWKSLGYGMVIYLAGLQGIPQHLYDAAAVDGANAWQRFRHVTLPMLTTTTFFVMVTSIISSFQVFGQVYVLTRGGPANATATMVYYIFQNAFQSFRMGYASALSWLLFVVIFLFTVIQYRAQRERTYYE